MNSLQDNILGIDHVAVAVPDLPRAVAWAIEQLGCSLIESRETRGQHSGMISAVMRLGPIVIVLVQGIGSRSQVTRFVESHGSGVQHIALRVDNLTDAIAAVQTGGLRFSTPRLDSDKLSQIFSERDPITGLMVEFIERRDYEGFSDENVEKLFHSLEKDNLY